MRAPRVYLVYGVITVSVSTEVVAATEEEAIALAGRRAMQSLCHQCASGDHGTEWILSGELDGEVEIGDTEVCRPPTDREIRRYYAKKGQS